MLNPTGTCPKGHDLTQPGATYQHMQEGKKRHRCRRCHIDTQKRYYQATRNKPQPDRYHGWAAQIWRTWTPHQRAEFAGAIQSLQDLIQGAAEAQPARKRHHEKHPA